MEHINRLLLTVEQSLRRTGEARRWSLTRASRGSIRNSMFPLGPGGFSPSANLRNPFMCDLFVSSSSENRTQNMKENRADTRGRIW